MSAIALSTEPPAYAEVNWGRWIAKCPGRHCTEAMGLNPDDTHFGCWTCGTTAPLVWPPDVPAVGVLLAMRPDIKTRNWQPHETLEDLLAENALHGVLPANLDGLAGPVMVTVDDQVVGGHLALAVAAAGRRELGG